MNSHLTIYEEETNLFWGLIILVSAAAGSVIVGDAFLSSSVSILGIRQAGALLLFLLAFYGIVKISEPLYRFEFSVSEEILAIKIYKGDQYVNILRYPLQEIQEMAFAPHVPPSENEALFDFTPNYHLVYKTKENRNPRKLIKIEDASITLEVRDIGKIIRFLKRHNPDIKMPDYQADFFGF